MKSKKIFILLLSVCIVFLIASCGITNEEFETSVKNYRIFNNISDMITVSDFIKKMESMDEDGDKITTMISTTFSESKLKEDDDFIQELKKSEDFNYNKDKYYGTLRVHVEIFSSTDYSTKENYTYEYLFSLDKNGNVTPEASTKYPDYKFTDYEEISTNSSDVSVSMLACEMLTETIKTIYSE